MRKIILTVSIAAGAVTVGASAQVTTMRRPPVIETTPPVGGTLNIAPRLRPAPSAYLNPDVLKQRIPPEALPPNLKADFQLTPAVQSVAGRGSLQIEGKVSVPDPLPPGFPGQAVLRNSMTGFATATLERGYVVLKLNAQRGVFYAVDCLASQAFGSNNINFITYGADGASTGVTTIAAGHVVFNVRRSVDTGEISIKFNPDRAKASTAMGELNITDFWGCQISSGA